MSIKQLYICEKPSQARDIAKVLGCHEKKDGYLKQRDIVVTWCFGHLLETANPDHYCENIKPWRLEILPIVPDAWRMQVKKESRQQSTVIKTLLKETEMVIVATDADREGEVIAREMLDICKYKGEIKRLWLSALDDDSIKKALLAIREGSTTQNLYHAGLGRQRADWLIGMNMTMASSVAFGVYGEGVLSVGRVQTPTLKLVVDRDYAIENFTSKIYFELFAEFETVNKEKFKAKWQAPEDKTDEEGRIIDQKIIDEVVANIHGKMAEITKFDDKEKKLSPPLGLSLSQLQKLASSRFNLSAKQTLDVAQALYETHKAITYPRTDCGYLPDSQFQEASAILSLLKTTNPAFADMIDLCDVNYRSLIWNDKNVTAHHAMIPTNNKHVNTNRMNAIEKNIYELISRYYIAQFLGPYEYAERSVVVNCHNEIFKASSQTPLKPGWKRILSQLDEIEEIRDSLIPALKKKEKVQEIQEDIAQKNTRPPARFTEGTLIEAMKSIGKYVQDEKYKRILKETAGIGTEATRAAIIETLFKRIYLEKKGKQIFATDKGKKLIAQIPPIACDPVLTAEWEQALDQVAEGKLSLNDFVEQQKVLLNKMLDSIKSIKGYQSTNNTSYKCPRCQQILIRRQAAKSKTFFWGCRGYPKCNFTSTDRNGVPIFVNTKM